MVLFSPIFGAMLMVKIGVYCLVPFLVQCWWSKLMFKDHQHPSILTEGSIGAVTRPKHLGRTLNTFTEIEKLEATDLI